MASFGWFVLIKGKQLTAWLAGLFGFADSGGLSSSLSLFYKTETDLKGQGFPTLHLPLAKEFKHTDGPLRRTDLRE